MKICIDNGLINDDIMFANDYNSKIVYSFITEPLFKFVDNKLECCACKSYECSKNFKIYKLNLRDDLYFYDGTKVNADDYKNVIEIIKCESLTLGNYLKNIYKIDSDHNLLIFYLKKPDRNFLKVFTMYQISPYKNNFTSGPYYISKISSNEIILKKNKYYRDKNLEDLSFIIIKDFNKQLEEYNKGNINTTCNTVFPIDREFNDCIIENGNMFFNIEFSIKLEKRIRKYIINLIDKDILSVDLNNHFIKKENFTLNSDFKTKKCINKLISVDKELTFAFSDFYPNEIIANKIKNQLESKGLKIKLVKLEYNSDFYKNSLKYDIRLLINYFEYKDDLYFYDSILFKTICNSRLYNLFIDLYKKTNKKIYLKFLYRIFYSKYFKEPLLSINFIYYSNCNFSFDLLNYK